MPVDFTAIDFETANSSAASACSVGLVRVRNGEVVERAGWLIQPPPGHDEFLVWNTRIHGLTALDVAGSLGWSAQLPALTAFVGDDVMVAHNAGFDMSVLRRASEATGDACPPYDYLCSLQVARKTYELDSYRLPMAAAAAGFTAFSHHDALADAEASARIVIDSAARHAAGDLATLVETLSLRIGRIAIAEQANV